MEKFGIAEEILIREINEYLALSDEELAGYGLTREKLEYKKKQLESWEKSVEEL